MFIAFMINEASSRDLSHNFRKYGDMREGESLEKPVSGLVEEKSVSSGV